MKKNKNLLAVNKMILTKKEIKKKNKNKTKHISKSLTILEC